RGDLVTGVQTCALPISSAAEAAESATATEAAAGAAESGRNPYRRGGHRWPLGRLDASHRTRVAALHSWVSHVWVPRVWPGARRQIGRASCRERVWSSVW